MLSPISSNSQTTTTSSETTVVSGSASQISAQSQLNLLIVQDSYDTALSSNDQSLALLYKTALSSINDALAPTLGANAIQNAAATQSNTPQDTASRIVSLSTGFFAAYKSQHPDLSNADALSSFMSTISGGFQTGFKEATDLLKGLGVFNGTVADNINQTYTLVQQGYAAFAAQNASPATGASATQSSS